MHFCQKNNMIVLDGDVPSKQEYRSKERIITTAGNFLFLPLVIEKNLFELLKDHAAFSRFKESLPRASALTYDFCYNNWPLEADQYNTNDFKHWYAQAEEALGDQNILFAFWCSEHSNAVDEFVDKFIVLFNKLAEQNDVDALPPISNISEGEESI